MNSHVTCLVFAQVLSADDSSYHSPACTRSIVSAECACTAILRRVEIDCAAKVNNEWHEMWSQRQVRLSSVIIRTFILHCHLTSVSTRRHLGLAPWRSTTQLEQALMIEALPWEYCGNIVSPIPGAWVWSFQTAAASHLAPAFCFFRPAKLIMFRVRPLIMGILGRGIPQY